MNTDSVAFYFQILHLLCGDAITLVSFPHLLNILYLMLLFILTTYVCCSNSKLNTSMYLITYRITSGVVLENLWLILHFFSLTPSSFLFCLKYVTFSGYWALRKETRLLFIYEHPLFLYLSLERKSQMCVFFKECWINLHNLQSCLPAVMSFWHASVHTKCLST